MIRFECASCGRKLTVPNEKAGGEVLCPSCYLPARVPDEPDEPAQEETPAVTSRPPLTPPRRLASAFTPQGLLGGMVGYVPSLDALAAKLVSVFPQNRDRPSHQALIVDGFTTSQGGQWLRLDTTAETPLRTAVQQVFGQNRVAFALLYKPELAAQSGTAGLFKLRLEG